MLVKYILVQLFKELIKIPMIYNLLQIIDKFIIVKRNNKKNAKQPQTIKYLRTQQGIIILR